MKSFLIAIFTIILLGYLGVMVAWWGIVLVALGIGFYLQMHGGLSFLSGLLGGGIFFGIYAMVLDGINDSLLSSQITPLLGFNPVLGAILIGGVLAAMGMLSGKYLRDVLLGETKYNKYSSRNR